MLSQANINYQALLDENQDAIIIFTLEGDLTYINPSVTALLGYSADELLHQPIEKIIAPNQAISSKKIIKALVKDGRYPSYERLFRHRDGTEIPVEITLTLIRDQANTPIYIQCIARDIRSRKNSEQAALANQLVVQHMTDAFAGIIYIYDYDTQNVTFISRSTASVLGYEQHRLRVKNLRELFQYVHPDDLQMIQEFISTPDKIAAEQSVTYEHRIRHRDGSWRWISWHERAFAQHPDGRIYQKIAIGIDITKRKEAELENEDQQIRLNLLNLLSSGAVFYMTADHVVTYSLRQIHAYFPQYRVSFSRVDLDYQAHEMGSLPPLDDDQPMVRDCTPIRDYIDQLSKMMPLIINDSTTDPRCNEHWQAMMPPDARAVLDIPVQRYNGMMGILRFASDTPHEWTEHEIVTLTECASTISIVLADAYQRAERERIDAELIASEERYRAVVNDQPDLILRWLPDYTITFTNQMYAHSANSTPEAMIGQNLLMFVPKKYHASIELHLTELSVENPVVTHEQEHNRDPQNIRWYQWVSRGFFNAKGQLTEIQTMAHDITALKATEAALRESEARYRSVLNGMAEGLIYQNAQGEVIATNPSAERIIGVRYSDETNKLVSDTLWQAVREDGTPFPKEELPPFVSLRTNKPVQNVIIGVQRPDNTVKWIMANTQPLLDESGKAYGVISTFIDITAERAAELEVIHQHRLLRVLIDNLRDFVYVKDREGRIVIDNLAHAQSFGKSPAEIVGKTDYDLFPDEMADGFVADDLVVMTTGTTLINREEMSYSVKGDLIWALTTKAPLYDEHGQIIGLVGLTRDISERRIAEAALRLSEARYRGVVEDQTEAICRYTPEGMITFANSAFSKYYGHTNQSIVEQNIFDLIGEPAGENLRIKLSTLTPDKPAASTISSRVGLDGRMRWQEWIDRAFFNEMGELIDVQAIGRDITAQKQAEFALLNEQQFISTVLNTTAALILVLDVTGRIVRFNRACEALSGVSEEEVIGKYIFELFIPTEYIAPLRASFEEMIEQRTSATFSNEWITHDGSRRLIEWSNTLIHNSKGEITHIVSSGIDVSTRRQLEEQSIELRIERERIHILNSFVRDMSHDFRTPLSVLNTSVYLLRKIDDTERREERLNLMENQVMHIDRLLGQLLLMSQLDSADLNEVREVDVNRILHQLINDYQHAPDKAALRLELSDTPLFIMGSEEYLFIAFKNLFDNTLRYTPDKETVTLRSYLHDDEAIIEFIDMGEGIPSADLPFIFERFYKADKARTADGTGAGLGLSIVKRVITLHHGEITVSSLPGKGSTFQVRLPIVPDKSIALKTR